ncbi:hypothetical protein [Agromyces archimandritae]|uniref:Cell division protein FtsL n=1 Tax=Agromyces archimandritae TaxID=2781962 RepID=A0A975INT3_9MICO|nr:hypothetical protein [Agromyces archimandritae]QTX04912.1 hypothetical protein G127AT_01210 [Agromyces archimandritae]
MSAIHAQTAPRGGTRGGSPRLRPAPRPHDRTKPSLGYAVIAVVVFLGIIAAQLVLSIGLAQGAYELDALRAEHADLDRQSQSLQEDLERVQSPQYLAANAEALGMVPNTNPVYLRLSDGAVLGEPTPAGPAAATGADVSNALIAGVPLVTAEGAKGDAARQPIVPPAGGGDAAGGSETGEGGAGGAGDPASTGARPEAPAAPDGLPTPATH